MKKTILLQTILLLAGTACFTTPLAAQGEIYPVAILNFEERGVSVKGQGANVRDLLFAGLIESGGILLVERTELDSILQEAELNLSGNIAPQQATQVGQLTGAKILITGSVFKVENKTYLVAKIIGTETGKVLGKSVSGAEDIGTLSNRLAKQVGKAIVESASQLMPPALDKKSSIARIRELLKGKSLPKVYVNILETHIGRTVADPAAETELIYIYKELGGEVIDKGEGDISGTQYKIVGEGFSEFSTRIKNLVSVKARLEVKVLDKKGEVVAIDRQTTVKVDLNEILAGKAALQEASMMIAERLIPKLAK